MLEIYKSNQSVNFKCSMLCLKSNSIYFNKRRVGDLSSLIYNSNLKQVRMAEKHLQIVLCEGTKIVQKHYQESIFKYINKSKKDFFIDNHLEEENWLSKIV